jgi:hypothetical protein
MTMAHRFFDVHAADHCLRLHLAICGFFLEGLESGEITNDCHFIYSCDGCHCWVISCGRYVRRRPPATCSKQLVCVAYVGTGINRRTYAGVCDVNSPSPPTPLPSCSNLSHEYADLRAETDSGRRPAGHCLYHAGGPLRCRFCRVCRWRGKIEEEVYDHRMAD